MVVKQTRQFFEPDDVMQLRIVCQHLREGEKCKGEVLYQFGPRKIPLEWRCPRCGEEWTTTFDRSVPVEMRTVPDQEAASLSLLNALETLKGKGSAPFSIRFEVTGEEKKNDK